METLLHNLIINASKYTPEQGEIEIIIKRTELGIQLRVEDSGPGINESEYDRVFERFYRIDGDRHSSGTVGCGLGLAIVRHIAGLHDAEISLDRSAKLGGLTVIIDFPHSVTSSAS